MSEVTRNDTEELCRNVCKSYKNKIETLINDAGRLSKNGQILVSNYENNLDSEKDFFDQAVNDIKFFTDYYDKDLLKIAKYCYTINKNFKLGVKFDSEITKIVPDAKEQKINLGKYESGWIFITDKNNQATKIINNNGNNIIFVNSQGRIIKKSIFSNGKYTQFFGDNLGITREAANELLIKAQYTWDGEKMQGGYKASDLQGKEVEPTIDGNIIEVKKEVTEAPKQKAGGSSIVSSKISNRIPQNDLRPSSPNGPCLFRALLAAAEEKIGQAFTLNDMNKIKKNCSKKDAKYIGNEEDEFFVNKHAQVIKAALTFKGYKNASVTWSSPRKSTVSGNSDYTIRFIKSKGHFQLGDKDGNLLWEPYKYNNHANAYTGKADGFNEITISLGAKE